jgi:hypothetical protein
MESSLAGAIAGRAPELGERAALVLAASVAAAVRVGLGEWLPAGGGGFVVVSGSLPELLRGALDPLRPALDAAG